jgi:molecular chaperone GrpE
VMVINWYFINSLKSLESKGLKPMEDLVGKPFDAETQEAITQIPAPTNELKGKVIDVVENGYTLGEKVIRYAKVVTGA